MATRAKMKISEPLGTSRLYLRLNPNATENQVLRKLLAALADVENAEQIRDAMLGGTDSGATGCQDGWTIFG